jgi:hypothetical protein
MDLVNEDEQEYKCVFLAELGLTQGTFPSSLSELS